MKKALLDTHVFLWLHTDPTRLGEVAERLADEATQLLLSAASAWEIAIKWQLGRLPLPERPESYVPSRARAIGATLLDVSVPDALAVAALPAHHRDPFDRLLVVQARHRRATLVTADGALSAYVVAILPVP